MVASETPSRTAMAVLAEAALAQAGDLHEALPDAGRIAPAVGGHALGDGGAPGGSGFGSGFGVWLGLRVVICKPKFFFPWVGGSGR